jgi:hypothetical protein
MVEFDIFQKCKPSFLPLGHTHDDVDQMFSRFSTGLKYNDAKTLPALAQVLKKSFNPTPIVEEVKTVGMWNRFLDPHIATTSTTHNITEPQVFIIKKDAEGVTRHHYHMEMQHSKKENPNCHLPLNRPGFQMFPNGEFPRYPFKIIQQPLRALDLKELRRTKEWLCDDGR